MRAHMERILLVALLSVLPLLAFADEPYMVQVFTGYLSASEFQELTRSQKVYYLMGMYDGLGAARLVLDVPSPSHAKWFKEMQEKRIDNFQLEAIVSKYLNDHPESWQREFSGLFVEALSDAWEKMKSQN